MQANALLDDPRFQCTDTWRELQNAPVGFVDVGARAGIHHMIEPIARRASVIAFEADTLECQHLEREHSESPQFAELRVVPAVLGSNCGTTPFHILTGPLNSSLLLPNQPFAQRYSIPGYGVQETVELPCMSLDELLFPGGDADAAPGASAGELLKLDAQGAELQILQNSTKTLSQRTVAILCEVEFAPLYSEQPLFSEVELYLRGLGFSFYGFSGESLRSARLRGLVGRADRRDRERLLHADACFFRESAAEQPGSRAAHALLVSAILLGFYDYASELVETVLPPEQRSGVQQLLLEWASPLAVL